MGTFWDGPSVLAVMSVSTAVDAGVSARIAVMLNHQKLLTRDPKR